MPAALKFVTLATLVLSPGNCAPAQEWTRFRGPNGAGVDLRTALPTQWTEDDFAWRIKLPGYGHASPVLWGERLFVLCGSNETGARIVSCVASGDGSPIWSREFEAETHRRHDLNSFASPTPVVDDQRVYVAWGTPKEIVVLALTHAGDEVWRADLGPFRSGHGFGVSPTLHGEFVILPVEHDSDSFRVALDRATGEVRWRVPTESSLHYATPCTYRCADGTEELIFTNWEQGICGVDPATGAVNWSADAFDKSHYEASISSPVIAGTLVIGVCGYLGRGYEAAAVDPTREGDKVVWRLSKGAPLCVTPLVVGDLVFFWSDQGIVTCVDAESGEVHWQQRVGGSFYSSPVCAGSAVYNISTAGEVVVLAAAPRYEELARNQLDEASHAAPAIAGGTMYLRTFTQLLSIRGRQ